MPMSPFALVAVVQIRCAACESGCAVWNGTGDVKASIGVRIGKNPSDIAWNGYVPRRRLFLGNFAGGSARVASLARAKNAKMLEHVE